METDASSVFSEESLDDVVDEGKEYARELQPRLRPEHGLLKDDDTEDELPKRREYDNQVYVKNLSKLEARSKAKTSVKYKSSEWSKILQDEPILLTADGNAPFIKRDKKISKYPMNEWSESEEEGEGKKPVRLRIRKRKDVVVKKTGKYDKAKRRKRKEENFEGEIDEAKKKRDNNNPPPPPPAGSSRPT